MPLDQSLLPLIIELLRKQQQSPLPQAPMGGRMPPGIPQPGMGPQMPSVGGQRGPGMMGGIMDILNKFGPQFDAQRSAPRQQTTPMMPPQQGQIPPQLLQLLQMLLSQRR